MSNHKILLQINVTANWGSTGKIAEQIGLLAMQQGWDSYIAYGRMMNPSKSKLIKIENQWDVYFHYILSRFFDMEGLASRRATRNLLKVIDKVKPTVVHLHNIHDHYLNYPILFEYLSEHDIPVVWTQHDLWAMTGHCCYIPDGCEKWKSMCNDCPLCKGLTLDKSKCNFLLKKELFTSLKSLTLVPVSEWVGGMAKESFLRDSNIRVIHNGVDINVFKPIEVDIHARYGLSGKKIVLGVASEWSERKGMKDIIKLAKILPKEKYAIIVVGKQLERVQEQPSDGCRIVYIDRTQNALELVHLYTAASVFVNPTYQDNYPTTNLEAIACGTPVVTYNTGGSPESVGENCGMIVAQGDVNALKEAIISIADKDVSIQCRKKAEAQFDSKQTFVEYLKLYDELAGGG